MNQTCPVRNNVKPFDRFLVVSLNLRFGLADDGPNSWEYRKNSFPVLLKRYRADFIGFQEVNNFQSDFLKKILPEYTCIGERQPAPSFWQNNIIFYNRKWECVYRDHFYLSPTPDIPSQFKKSRWPRQCTLGIFQRADRRLLVVNTHFDFDSIVQTQSAELIMKRISEISSEMPGILMGDFNATPESPCYNVFTGQKTRDKNNGKKLFANAFTKPFPGTFHGFNDDKKGDHIDWILYCGGLSPKESKVIHGKINGIYPSDHFPLFAVFKWKKEER